MTERDMEFLGWVGRWRGVTSRQVAREFGRRGELPGEAVLAERVVYRRLAALEELGAVSYSRPFESLPRVYSVTGQGMKLAGLVGSVVRPKVSDIHHDLAVVDLAHELSLSKPGDQLVTEREIRHLETPGFDQEGREFRFSASMSDSSGRKFPDLASVREVSGGSTEVFVHEVERTRKAVPRLVRNMLMYVYASHIRGAVFWAYPPLFKYVQEASLTANERSVELGRGRKIAIREWDPEKPRSRDGE
ncbi:replication-relaxation family protein [Kitasatospora sp. NPDC001660]